MAEKAKTYAFGDFRFVPSESLLLKQDAAVPLPQKALRLLEKLVENAGRVVTKDELIRDVWDELAVEESAVARTVFLVRTALGDDPRNHAFIQTVPKRGYRFVAEVSTLERSAANAMPSARALPAPEDGGPPVPDVRHGRPSAVHLTAVLLLFIGALTSSMYLGFFRSAPAPNKPSLLVMPFSPAGDPRSDELLENGIADALIHHIASSRDLTVRSLSATRSYTGTASDPVQAGREQRVSKVLSASYQRADGELRILARLIDVETGTTDETFRFATAETRVFAIQDAVAANLGDKIAARLGIAPGHARTVGTLNEEAYRHYFQGMALFDKGNRPKAVESLDRAIELDSNFARAWVGKAVALGSAPSLGGSSSRELYEITVQAASRALDLDAESGDAYSAICGAKLTYAHDFAGAGKACARAMELDPDSPIVLQSYSFFLVSQGRLDDAIGAVKAALEREPASYFSHSLYANTLYLARRYDEAYSQYVSMTELQPERLPTYEWMIRTLEAGGREPEAVEWLIKSLRIRHADETLVARIRQAYTDAGWPGVLRVRIETEKDRLNHFRQAGLHARLGNKDAAFQALEKAYEQRPPVFVTLRTEPQFDSVRDDPRFTDLLKRLESGSNERSIR